jgi:hypothetical protein
VERGERELSPPLHHLHPSPHHHLLRIRAQREFPPLVPSQPPIWQSEAASFPTMPVDFCSQHGWPPASPHPKAR